MLYHLQQRQGHAAEGIALLVALPECAYAAGRTAGLKLTVRGPVCKTRNENQTKAPAVFFIKSVRNA